MGGQSPAEGRPSDHAERVGGPRYRRGVAKAPATEIQVGDRTVRISNPDRVYFPATGATKLDLVDYYLAVGAGDRERAAGAAVHDAPLPQGCERGEGPPEARARGAPRPGWRPCG